MRDAGITMQKRDSDVFAEIAFTGLELVPPGVVLVSEWRPAERLPPSGASRGEHLRRGRPQTLTSSPETPSRDRLGLRTVFHSR